MSHRNKSTRSMKYLFFWVDKNGIPMRTSDVVSWHKLISVATVQHTVRQLVWRFELDIRIPKAGLTFSCKSSSKFVTSSCVLRSLIKPLESLDFLSWDKFQITVQQGYGPLQVICSWLTYVVVKCDVARCPTMPHLQGENIPLQHETVELD